jgi:hypothetical protein
MKFGQFGRKRVIRIDRKAKTVRHVNKVAWKRNEAGRGNFMTRPIWGRYARPPRD